MTASGVAEKSGQDSRWLPFGAVVLAIVIQLALPEQLSVGPGWVLPSVEGALALGLLIANPFRGLRETDLIRRASIVLVAVMSLANGSSAALLINDLVGGRLTGGAGDLLANGAGVYVTNILAFGLWYWELDRGGPRARATSERPPDFLFPQMSSGALASPGWRPGFIDYLYISFTNALAFSPTDAMPLTRWAKMLMLTQSAISLVTLALVIARAVGIFK